MNIQTIIDSGDLELYVLGALPEQDMRRITRLAETHSKLRSEIDAIELAVIRTAETVSSTEPSDQVLALSLAEIDEEQATVKPITSAGTSSSSSFSFRPVWAWAAAIALLIGSSILNVMFYQDLSETEQDLLALRQENLEIANNANQASFEYDELSHAMAVLQSPGIRRIDLEGVEGKEGNRVTVFWEPNQAEVLLANANLSIPPSGKQYQLWAIIDGQPVDAGLLDGLDNWQQMKAISGNAAAFAITLEPEGGSISPTLEEMVVIGTVG